MFYVQTRETLNQKCNSWLLSIKYDLDSTWVLLHLLSYTFTFLTLLLPQMKPIETMLHSYKFTYTLYLPPLTLPNPRVATYLRYLHTQCHTRSLHISSLNSNLVYKLTCKSFTNTFKRNIFFLFLVTIHREERKERSKAHGY